MKAGRVLRFDQVQHASRIFFGSLFENRGQRSARIFGIDINASAKYGLLANVGSREIELALDRKVSLVLDLLGDDFAEDQLLSEVLGAYDDAVIARRPAGS